eukprot:g20994.t1
MPHEPQGASACWRQCLWRYDTFVVWKAVAACFGTELADAIRNPGASGPCRRRSSQGFEKARSRSHWQPLR